MAFISLLRLPSPFLSRPPTVLSQGLILIPKIKINIPNRRRAPISVSAVYTPTPATDRLVSALSYTLPFFNSIHYGRFFFARVPALAAALSPVFPLLSVYRSFPYASFVAFFALYLGVVRNPAFSRYVRFNSMQAVVLDVFLALPTLVQRIFGVPSRGIGFKILEFGYNAVFLFSFGCFIYGLVSSVLGKTPYLPIVASAADRQLWKVRVFIWKLEQFGISLWTDKIKIFIFLLQIINYLKLWPDFWELKLNRLFCKLFGWIKFKEKKQDEIMFFQFFFDS